MKVNQIASRPCDGLFIHHLLRGRSEPNGKLLSGLTGVKRNFWPIVVFQLFCFSEQRNKVWRLLFWRVFCKL